MGRTRQTAEGAGSARLSVGLLASLLLHAGVAMAWLSPSKSESEALAPDPTINQSTIRLGIERSPHRTIAWLGFIDPTEHLAPDREVEQSALAPFPPAAPAAPAAAADPAAVPGAAVARLLSEISSRAGPAIDRWYEPRREALIAILQAAARALQQAQASESEPAEPVAEQSPPAAPAIESPKEADASATDKPIEYRNGRVAAGEGLDITTVRPNWALSTRITASPRNPMVIVEFTRDGRVRSAVFEGVGSGFESVDGPLLDAIYAWKAKGDRLEELAPDDPGAVLTVRIRVYLR